MPFDFPGLRRDLEQLIHARVGNRVRNLDIQLSPEGVVLQGFAGSFHVKQLAQHSVREMLPQVQLQNAIQVD